MTKKKREGEHRLINAWYLVVFTENLAERVGFEPTEPREGLNGFRDRPIRPLWHLSAYPYYRAVRHCGKSRPAPGPPPDAGTRRRGLAGRRAPAGSSAGSKGPARRNDVHGARRGRGVRGIDRACFRSDFLLRPDHPVSHQPFVEGLLQACAGTGEGVRIPCGLRFRRPVPEAQGVLSPAG